MCNMWSNGMTETKRTKLEWCEREREKLKARIAATNDPTLLAHYRAELGAMSQLILASSPKS